MEKVAFISVPSFSKSAWLNSRMADITDVQVKFLNEDRNSVYRIESYSDINNYLDKAEILVVITDGNIFIDRDTLWNRINNMPTDVGLMAHLLQHSNDDTVYFDDQFFMIRTSAVSSLDFLEASETGLELIRSAQSVHDDYTPLEVTLGTNTVNRTMKFGSKIIEHVLSNGMRVTNFDNAWRYGTHIPEYVQDGTQLPIRGYLYPKKSTAQFEEMLRTWKLVDGVDDAQEKFYHIINRYMNFNFVNVKSFEVPAERPEVQVVIAPAAGFIGELTAHYTYAEKLILFDINPNNIEFKKHLYANWDGNNYENFAKEWCDAKGLAMEPSRPGDLAYADRYTKETERHVINNWNQFRHFEVEFMHIDIIKDIDKLLAGVEKTPRRKPTTLLHTSTILQYDKFLFTTLFYSKEEVDTAIEKIRANPNVFWYWPGIEIE